MTGRTAIASSGSVMNLPGCYVRRVNSISGGASTNRIMTVRTITIGGNHIGRQGVVAMIGKGVSVVTTRASAATIGATNTTSTVIHGRSQSGRANQVYLLISQNLVTVTSIVMDLIARSVVNRHGGC